MSRDCLAFLCLIFSLLALVFVLSALMQGVGRTLPMGRIRHVSGIFEALLAFCAEGCQPWFAQAMQQYAQTKQLSRTASVQASSRLSLSSFSVISACLSASAFLTRPIRPKRSSSSRSSPSSTTRCDRCLNDMQTRAESSRRRCKRVPNLGSSASSSHCLPSSSCPLLEKFRHTNPIARSI